MDFRPLGDRVLVRRNEELERVGGLYVPDSAKEKATEGVVLAVGPGEFVAGTFVPMRLTVGDTILFGKYSGSEITMGGESLICMKQSDVLGVIQRQPAEARTAA